MNPLFHPNVPNSTCLCVSYLSSLRRLHWGSFASCVFVLSRGGVGPTAVLVVGVAHKTMKLCLVIKTDANLGAMYEDATELEQVFIKKLALFFTGE